MWVISAVIVWESDWGKTSVALPTFYLNRDIQGFLDEEGCRKVVESLIRTINPQAKISSITALPCVFP